MNQSELDSIYPIRSELLEIAKTDEIHSVDLIQSLWSGYGSLVRVHFLGNNDSKLSSLIVKHINFHQLNSHPRGWNSNLSHERKVKSYQVEQHWYSDFANELPKTIKIPHCYQVILAEGSVFMILEDLANVGFPILSGKPNENTLKACIRWLAHFHAFHLQVHPQGLWRSGTYWHLETRPDELDVLKGEHPQLAQAAAAINLKLNQSPYQTLVHGDAKIANFCFSDDGKDTAAVDFQYIGGGIGMKDFAYFLGSCLSENECEAREIELLNLYFSEFRQACQTFRIRITKKFRVTDHSLTFDTLVQKIEDNWRKLYPYAWADFHRFLKGWSPGHWKINSYSEAMCQKVIKELNQKS